RLRGAPGGHDLRRRHRPPPRPRLHRGHPRWQARPPPSLVDQRGDPHPRALPEHPPPLRPREGLRGIPAGENAKLSGTERMDANGRIIAPSIVGAGCRIPFHGGGDMKKFRNVVWEGRFQPFHRGHCEYVRRLLDYGERVWIYVVANEVSTEVVEDPSRLPVPEFTRAVDPHHAPSKNVLPLWLRCLIVQRAVASEFGPDAPISVSSGRRLDLDWAYYEKNLPPDRVFLTPLRDSFEDVKAASDRKSTRLNSSHVKIS